MQRSTYYVNIFSQIIEEQLKNSRFTKESRAMLEQRLGALKAQAEQFELSLSILKKFFRREQK